MEVRFHVVYQQTPLNRSASYERTHVVAFNDGRRRCQEDAPKRVVGRENRGNGSEQGMPSQAAKHLVLLRGADMLGCWRRKVLLCMHVRVMVSVPAVPLPSAATICIYLWTVGSSLHRKRLFVSTHCESLRLGTEHRISQFGRLARPHPHARH